MTGVMNAVWFTALANPCAPSSVARSTPSESSQVQNSLDLCGRKNHAKPVQAKSFGNALGQVGLFLRALNHHLRAIEALVRYRVRRSVSPRTPPGLPGTAPILAAHLL
jgi:hypothetical protein